MAGFSFSVKALKAGFFDTKDILAAADKAEIKVQSQFGAFVRRRMKSSIKYQDGTAPAGKPPFAHRSKGFTRRTTKKGVAVQQSSSPLRELIYFARDPATKSVVIGPAAFGAHGAGTLERGGTATIRRRGGPKKTVRIRPHPFAEPAGRAEAEKLPDLLRNMIN